MVEEQQFPEEVPCSDVVVSDDDVHRMVSAADGASTSSSSSVIEGQEHDELLEDESTSSCWSMGSLGSCGDFYRDLPDQILKNDDKKSYFDDLNGGESCHLLQEDGLIIRSDDHLPEDDEDYGQFHHQEEDGDASDPLLPAGSGVAFPPPSADESPFFAASPRPTQQGFPLLDSSVSAAPPLSCPNSSKRKNNLHDSTVCLMPTDSTNFLLQQEAAFFATFDDQPNTDQWNSSVLDTTTNLAGIASSSSPFPSSPKSNPFRIGNSGTDSKAPSSPPPPTQQQQPLDNHLLDRIQVGIRLRPATDEEETEIEAAASGDRPQRQILRKKPKRTASASSFSGLTIGRTFSASSMSGMFSLGDSSQHSKTNTSAAWDVDAENKTIVQHTSKASASTSRKLVGNRLNQYTFDAVFPGQSTTKQVYQAMAKPIVRAALTGRHGSIFCYGQTGSGKTFTMQGSADDTSGSKRIVRKISFTEDDDESSNLFHEGRVADEQYGMVQLAACDLFDWIQQDPSRQYVVRAKYFEIYNEDVRDLLFVGPPGTGDRDGSRTSSSIENQRTNGKGSRGSSGRRTLSQRLRNHHYSKNGKRRSNSPTSVSTATTSATTTATSLTTSSTLPSLQLGRDSHGNVTVLNAFEEEVVCVNDIVELLELGNRNRACASTERNSSSSRSHAIFRLTIESRPTTAAGADDAAGRQPTKSCMSSVLNLVDLAGSESGTAVSGGSSSGVRLREGGKINQSLLSLSRVIQSLSLEPKKRPKHIGYRDSKLTRILQPHLSGNACMAILCCISPLSKHVEETKSTLKFASNAKRVEMAPVVNQVLTDSSAMVIGLKRELAETKDALIKLQQYIAESSGAVMPLSPPPPVNSKQPKQVSLDSHFSKMRPDQPQQPHDGRSFFTAAMQQNGSPKGRKMSIDPLQRLGDGSLASPVTAVQSPPVNEVVISMQKQAIQKKRQESIADQQQQQALASSPGSNARRLVASLPFVEPAAIGETLEHDGFEEEQQQRLQNAESRARLLERKLEATDDLVETLFHELETARRYNQGLLERNGKLYEAEAFRSDDEVMDGKAMRRGRGAYYHENDLILLIKYTFYLSCALYLLGQDELALAAIVFLWLSLEVAS